MDKQLIIVIGLPGSGKTSWCKNQQEYIIFDDFISTFYDGEIISALVNNKKVCINDPRLCIFDIFARHINIMEEYINRNNIYLVLFENNPQQCIINAHNRIENKYNNMNTFNPKQKNLEKQRLELNITEYAKKYSINNYLKWNHIIINVYSE
ncbi:hypothetical protein [Powai lake megavirus]|uniref:Uncharacterized protein n=1 Tax=Powai lake megavirus TaxID=1842663 RepID=A0A160EQU1_9VIRU|nr:hypothetical protein QJ849_gp879 [Powai lake megavirus]ANB51041.1 hypothetical protein [Powai lake megavirus]